MKDIVEIAKILRKEFKKEFGDNLKVSIRTSRHWGCDELYITIKKINKDYLIPINTYMEEYQENYYRRHGIKHPYINDETFEKWAKFHIDRIKQPIYEKIKEIANQFVIDNSDIMTDYFDRNYIAQLKLEINNESLGGYTLL